VAFQHLKEGASKKDGDKFFSRVCSDRTKSNGFKLKEGTFRPDIRKKFFTMRVVAQRGGRCPSSGNVQAQVGRGSQQPALVEDVPAYCKGVGLDGL